MSDLGNEGISQEVFEQGKEDRLRLESIRPDSNCIFRMLLPSQARPPYAIEIFANIVAVQEPIGPHWEKTIVLDCDRPRGGAYVPMDKESFVVTPNIGPRGDPELDEAVVRIGYLLGVASLSDFELEALRQEMPTPQ